MGDGAGIVIQLSRKLFQKVVGWRDMPTDNSSLGNTAKKSEFFKRRAFHEHASWAGSIRINASRTTAKSIHAATTVSSFRLMTPRLQYFNQRVSTFSSPKQNTPPGRARCS